MRGNSEVEPGILVQECRRCELGLDSHQLWSVPWSGWEGTLNPLQMSRDIHCPTDVHHPHFQQSKEPASKGSWCYSNLTLDFLRHVYLWFKIMVLAFYLGFISKFGLFRNFLPQSAESLIKAKAGSCFIPVCSIAEGAVSSRDQPISGWKCYLINTLGQSGNELALEESPQITRNIFL